MFGTYRYILAILVVLTHLWPFLFHTDGHWTGPYAVYSFYMLSGYLMTLVLNERYAYSLTGLGRFLTNRALRIYPPYLVVMFLTLALVLLNPGLAREFNGHLQPPASIMDWVHNITIFGLHERRVANLVPPSWSLNIELTFYLVMAFALSRKKYLVILWFAASLLYTGYAVTRGLSLEARYFSLLPASLPFSAGALIYFIKDRFKTSRPLLFAGIAMTLYLSNVFLTHFIFNDMFLEGFYLSMVLAFFLTISLVNVDAGLLGRRLGAADRFLGDLSYPLFLSHWFVALLVLGFVFNGVLPKGGGLFIYTLPFVHITALLINRLVEQKVGRIRKKIRPGHR